MKNASNHSIQIFLVLFTLVVFGAGIWSSSILTQGDESDYIRSSQEMLASGDFLTPTFRGEIRFTKPPMLYWMLVVSYEIFGVNYFASRLPTVLCAVLTVVFVFRMGVVLFNRKAAFIAALLTGTSFGMVKFSKIALMESPLILILLLAFYYFVRFYKEENNSLLIASFLFVGFSALLKSPVYSILTVATMVLFMIAENAFKRLYCRELLLAVMVALLTAVPWYLTMTVMHSSLFTDFYLNEHVNKFEAVNHHLLRVWIGLLLYLLPWTFYFIVAVAVILVKGLYREWSYKILLLVIGLFLLIFMLPNQKGLYYSIPLLPYCGLVMGGVLASGLEKNRVSDSLTALVLLLAGAVFALGAVLLDSNPLFSLLAALLVSAAAVAILLRRDKMVPVVLVGFAMVPIYSGIMPSVNLDIIPVDRALELAGPKPFFSYKLSPLKFTNSLACDVSEVLEVEKLKNLLEGGGVVIIRRVDYRQIKKLIGGDQVQIVLEWKRWRRRIPFAQVAEALINGRPGDIQERLYLISR